MLINNIAEQIWRFQERLYFKYEPFFRRPWYLLRRVVKFLVIPLVGIGFIFGGAEQLIKIPAEELGPLEHLVPTATWLNARFSSEIFGQWFADGVIWLFSLPVSGVIVLVLITIGCLYLLWPIPKILATREQKKADQRLKLLQRAVHPVPSRTDIGMRFVKVFLVIWGSLTIFQGIQRLFGYCFVCESVPITQIVWFIIAGIIALFSIYNMHEERANREVARKQLKTFNTPVWLKIGRTIVQTFIGISAVAIVIGVIYILVILIEG